MSTATAPRTATQTRTIEQEKSTDALVLDQAIEATIRKADRISSEYLTRIDDETLGRLHRTFLTAKAIDQLKSVFDNKVMDLLLPLVGTPLGFRTDRDKEGPPYSREVVRDCIIAALLQGFYPFNNEFNIIGGNFMAVQNGERRRVQDLPGLTDLNVSPGIPGQHNGQTVIRVDATWKMNGFEQQLMGADRKPGRVFYVRVNKGMDADGLTGKALRKAYKAIYEKATGKITEDDSWAEDLATTSPAKTNGEAKPDPLSDRLASKANGTPKPAEAAPTKEEIPVAEAMLDNTPEYFTIHEALEEANISGPKCAAAFGHRKVKEMPLSLAPKVMEWIAANKVGDAAE